MFSGGRGLDSVSAFGLSSSPAVCGSDVSASGGASLSENGREGNNNNGALSAANDKEAPVQSTLPSAASTAADREASAATASLENALDNLVSQMGSSSLSFDSGLRMMESLRSSDIVARMEATQAYRRSLSSRQDGQAVASARPGATCSLRGNSPSRTGVSVRNPGPVLDIGIDEFLDAALLGEVVRSLRIPDARLQLESVLLVQRLCKGTSAQIQRVVTDELLDAVVDLLNDLSFDRPGGPELRVAIFSLLTHIAVDAKKDREISPIRRPGVLPAVLRAANLCPSVEAVRCVQAVVHPCFCTSDMRSSVLKFLVGVMSVDATPASLSLACNACVALCDTSEGVSVVLNAKAMPHILQLLRHPDESVVFDALSITARIAFIGTTGQIDQVIGMGAVDAMVSVLTNPSISSPMARARACNTIGNLGCETPTQVQVRRTGLLVCLFERHLTQTDWQLCFTHSSFTLAASCAQAIIDTQAFPLLLEIFQEDPDYNTRIEAAYAVCACLSRASAQQVGSIVCCTTRAPSFGGRKRPSTRVFFCQHPDEPSVLSLNGHNPCLHLIADMLELVAQSDPSNIGSLKLCKAILKGLENILEVGVQEGRNLDLPENPYARLFQAVQVSERERETVRIPKAEAESSKR